MDPGATLINETIRQISLLLQYHVQLPDGTLVLDTRGKMPIGVERPGIIRYFGLNGEANDR